jgi:8-oxo-dGTP pyrophosphatase MutT (NUDIX family)
MRSAAWQIIGRVVFYAGRPVFIIYLRLAFRTRVIITTGDSILLTRGWLGDGKWVLPGGGLHRGEKKESGAIREVYEETGVILQPPQLQYLGRYIHRHQGFRITYEMFCADADKELLLTPQRFEIIKLQWVPVSEITPKNAAADTIAILHHWQKTTKFGTIKAGSFLGATEEIQ